MDDSKHDLLAYLAFPTQHRTKLHSTHPLDRNRVVRKSASLARLLQVTAPNKSSFGSLNY